MSKYRKKPVVIEAIQYTGNNQNEILNFAKKSAIWHYASGILSIYTLENFQGESLVVSKGDWVIKGVKGEFYPCKPDIFEQTYELVEE
jgi:hypothetical protein